MTRGGRHERPSWATAPDRGARARAALVALVCLVALATACAAARDGIGSPAPRGPAAPARATPSDASGVPGATTTTTTMEAEPVVSGFVAFGDFGGGEAQPAVAAAMERWAADHRVDALVTTGDNVYEVGDPRLFPAQLDVPYRALRRSRPMWATLGNHDVAAGHGQRQLAHLGLPPLPYEKRLPSLQLLFLDANQPDEAQARWLDRRLAEPGPGFRVAVFHQPAHSCGPHGSTRAVVDLWVPVLERHRVALVLTGHDHAYQRFTSRGGVTYVVTGGGGRQLYPVRRACLAEPTQQAYAVRHHFVAVEVRPRSMTVVAVADDDTVLDRAVVPHGEGVAAARGG